MSNNKSLDGMVNPTASKAKNNNSNFGHRLAWTGMLFVVLSIGFSSYMVYFGTDNLVAKVMLIPQIAFAAGIAIYAFAFKK